jgi:predicted secreted acid phosphatase
MIKMKRHITAALTISALALASCGTQKEAAEAAAPAPVVKEVNEALNWSVKNAEARYLYSQNMRLAAYKVHDLMNKGESVGKAVFIEPTFLLFNQNMTYEYFANFGSINDEFNIGELRGYCRNQYEPQALEFIRMCSEAGMEVILMAPEKEAIEIMQDLQKQNFQVFASMMTSQPQYGKYAENITLREYAAGNRVALVLTSSLGEASEFTMSRGPKGFELNEIFKAFGDRLILFPNPAFN